MCHELMTTLNSRIEKSHLQFNASSNVRYLVTTLEKYCFIYYSLEPRNNFAECLFKRNGNQLELNADLLNCLQFFGEFTERDGALLQL
jgi:hypothetical protein